MNCAKTFLLSFILISAGCMSLTPESRIPLRAGELAVLKSHKDIVVLADGTIKGGDQKFAPETPKDERGFFVGSFRYRLLNYAAALKLTSEEVRKLSSPGDVVLCGKCGNLKGSSDCCDPSAETSRNTGYAKNSLVDRVLGY